MDWFPDMFWLFVEWWLWILLGVLLGLALGWFIWRRAWVAERTTLHAELDTARSERASLRAQVADSEESLASNAAVVADYESRLKTLTADLKQRTLEVETYEIDLAAKEASFAELKGEIDARDAQIQELSKPPEPSADKGASGNKGASETSAPSGSAGEASDAFSLRMEALAAERPAEQADDLKEISGVGPKMEEMLNEQGLTTFYQVALLDHEAVAALENRLDAFPGRIERDEWVPQAAALHQSHHGDDLSGRVTIAPSAERQALRDAGHADFFEASLAKINSERPADYQDDLQQIKGVGPVMEKLLNDNGLTTFFQVSRLDDAAVDDLEGRLDSFPGRIRRDSWVSQAGQLHIEHHES